MKQRPWIDNERLIEIAQDMQVCFEFNLHSRSTPNEIALVARQYLIDEGLPYPKTVCLLVAKYARLIWMGEMELVKLEQALTPDEKNFAESLDWLFAKM